MSYKDQMQQIANDYFFTHQKQASARDIARWAIENDLWKPPLELAERKCADDLATAMREDYITAPDGKRIRRKHAATILKDGKQQTLWADMFNAPRKHIETAVQQRRQQILGDCRQLKYDADYYNQTHKDEMPIQPLLDFEEDLAEEEALRNMKKAA